MSGKGIEILLVEDNENDAELTTLALKKCGLDDRLLWVKNGNEALDFLFARGIYTGRDSGNKPKMILLDLKLPGVSGMDVLKEIRANVITKLVPVIMFTCSEKEKDIAESYNLGASDFIVKQVDYKEFIAAVSRLAEYWLGLSGGSNNEKHFKEKQNRILLLEDSITDAELQMRELKKAGLDFISRRVESEREFLEALEDFRPDLILSDNALPSFNGLSALQVVRAKYPDLPFIFVSGTIGEERAIESLKRGATDYVLKNNLGKLVPAVRRALNELEERQERRQLQEQLLRAQKLETIGTLVGGIAHDFNNIICAIKGNAELLLSAADKSGQKEEYLSNILTSSDRAANLIRQLLVFTKGQSTELKPLNLNDVINNLLKMLNRLIGENIRIETNYTAESAIVMADSGNIEQVLMNLVVNARDAMPGGGRISIKTENISIDENYCRTNIESRCGNFVCLTVEDSGIGMSRDVLQHIFEPFFTTKPHGKGTGLGLFVIYGIIRKHDGWVNVYSEPGQGSVFRIYIPVTSQKTAVQHDTKRIKLQDLKGNGERILVVEDDEGLRKLVRSAMEEMNYRVFVASSGAEARDIFDRMQGDFNIIISDMVLPDVIGIDLYDELSKKKPDIMIILSSGYSRGEHIDIIHKRGIPFIPKPYNLSEVFRTIRELIEKRTRERD